MDIPGYHYDKHKGKYFKIIKKHHASPSGSKYSEDKIRQEKKGTLAWDAVSSYEERKSNQTVKRVRETSWLGTVPLTRELGLKPANRNGTWGAAFSAGVHSQMLYKIGARFFALDPATRTLFLAHENRTVTCPRLQKVPIRNKIRSSFKRQQHLEQLDSETLYPYSYQRAEDPHYALTSQISSLSYLPASGTLITTTLGSDRPPVIHLSNPTRDGPGIAEMYTVSDATTVWTSVPRPTSSSFTANSVLPKTDEMTAFGVSNSLTLMYRDETGAWTNETPCKLEADVRALTWLSPTTVAMGCRDRAIHIYDTRSRGSSHILTHTTGVCTLHSADDFTRLVCAGLANSLVLYDMRMPKASARSGQQHQTQDYSHAHLRQEGYSGYRVGKKGWNRPKSTGRQLQTSHAGTPSSIPVVTFPWSNQDTEDIGVDVHPHLNLIAGGDELGRLLVWNLKTGDVLKDFGCQPGMKKFQPDRRRSAVRCVRFVEDYDTGGDVSVWATWNDGVVRFGW